MSTLRERKPTAGEADVNDSSAAAPSSASASVPASSRTPSQKSSSKKSLLHFIPYIFLFLTLFFTFSYIATGTIDYGLGPVLWKDGNGAFQVNLGFERRLNQAKIFVQELAGLRTPKASSKNNANKKTAPVPSATDSTNAATLAAAADSPDMGYGGITPKKKKKSSKKKPAKSTKTYDEMTEAERAEEAYRISIEEDERAAAALLAKGIDPEAIPEPQETSKREEKEEPLLDIRVPTTRDPKDIYLTPEEMKNYRGYDGSPIYLAIYARIIDVTSAPHFYGPEGGYSNMAGKDATRAFATNCYDHEKLWDLRGLTYAQRKSIDGWYKFYMEHDTYKPIGWVVLPEVDQNSPIPVDTC